MFIRGHIKREVTVLIENGAKFFIRNDTKRTQVDMKRKQIDMVKVDTVVTLIGIYPTERKRELGAVIAQGKDQKNTTMKKWGVNTVMATPKKELAAPSLAMICWKRVDMEMQDLETERGAQDIGRKIIVQIPAASGWMRHETGICLIGKEKAVLGVITVFHHHLITGIREAEAVIVILLWI